MTKNETYLVPLNSAGASAIDNKG